MINLSVWTVIFIVLGFYLNGYIYKETTSGIIVLLYSLLGTLFLIGLIISWIKVFKK